MLAMLPCLTAASVTLPAQKGRLADAVNLDLPIDHPSLARDPTRVVEQVHVGMGARPDEVWITWVTNQSSMSSVVEITSHELRREFTGSHATYSFFQTPKDFEVNCTGYDYTNSSCYYTSDFIHTVHVTGLPHPREAVTYQYQISGDTVTRRFKMPPAVGTPAISFGVVADLGQTANSTETVDSLYRHAVTDGDIDAILFAVNP